jgi:predicted TIM-barrel fold metal-dependent hydrolase
MVIDPHTILTPPDVPNELPGSPEALIAAMDRAGVDLGGAYCRDHSYTAQAVEKYPDRIFGMAFILPSDEGSLEKLEHALKVLKFKGTKLNMPSSLAALRSNSVMDQVYSLLIDYDAVLLAHSAEGDHTFSLPYQFEQVARAFPRLKIIMAHIGVPDDFEEAIKVATWNDNVYLSSHAAPSSVVRMAVERAGAHKVMLGADWPHEDFEVEVKKIEMAVPNDADRRLVLGENAQRIFNFR